MTLGRLLWVMGILTAGLVGAIVLALSVGTVRVGFAEIFGMLFGKLFPNPVSWTETQETIVLSLRLPRTLLAGIVGSALALAGAGFQAISRNPLADPYILGVSSGAAFGVVMGVLTGLGAGTGILFLPLFGFVGALVAAVVVYGIASIDGRLPVHTLLLAGVVVSLFFSSAIMLASALMQAEELQGVVFYLMGNLRVVSYPTIGIVLGCLLIGTVLIYGQVLALNLLSAGEEAAAQLGVEPEWVKRIIFVACSLVTGAAVSASGSIAFVGLMVPHAVRLCLGSDNRLVIPASLFGGAIFLILADIVARTVAAPLELPVGVITAFVGAPFFAYLLRSRYRSVYP
ncbi:MAG: FecCD family ABC transporter permease [Candidatus Methylomirabilales bacterium]|jgi:iron complex transport system permease protein|nr:iron ABC transporter permease [candidate division NC10 bacterium]